MDRAIAAISPRWAFRRRQYAALLAQYDAANPGRLRKNRNDSSSGTALAERSAVQLRNYARYLHRNHDVARGALRILVNNTVGPNGIGVEPQPLNKDGEIIEPLAKQLLDLYRDWSLLPEVTGQMSWARAQRMVALSWYRDGEVLSQVLAGPVRKLNHGTRVPLSLELLESDYLPMDYSDTGKRIRNGIEVNAWGRPVNYWVFKQHPGDSGVFVRRQDLKSVPATRMLRLALVDRLGQLRGVSEFASIMTRLDDIKDYEESERIAAKVAASMAAVIKKGSPDEYKPVFDENGDTVPRNMKFRPGMIFDDLLPGESIETIDTNRPNPNVESFRTGQIRAASAGVGVSYSSMSKDYNGTYSAQRQEMVEQWVNYAVLSSDFISGFVQPVWRHFVAAAHAAGLLDIPDDIDWETLDDAMFVTPAMPWIDPKKEADAFTTLEAAGYISGPEIIRRRGGNPSETLKQEANWRKKAEEAGVGLSFGKTGVNTKQEQGNDNQTA